MSEKRVLIICPVCGSKNKIPIPADVITQKETGATSVYIPTGMVCEHEFYAYIDKNFAVRDYLVLEYSLQDESKQAARIKKDIVAKADKLNLEFENIKNFISETDFRSLLYACFIESHIVLLEDNLESERFGVLYNVLAKLFPEVMERSTIYTPQGFLKYKENNEALPDGITVYNLDFKLSVVKPFMDSDSEPFEKIIEILKQGSHKLQIIYAKNYIDYLRKFSDEIVDYLMQPIAQVSKIYKKKYPDHADKFTFDVIRAMRRRYKFKVRHDENGIINNQPIIDLIEENFSGKTFIYNESVPVVTLLRREYESQIEKVALKLLRTHKRLKIRDLIQKLEEKEKEMNVKFDFSKLFEIINEFIDQNFIHAK